MGRKEAARKTRKACGPQEDESAAGMHLKAPHSKEENE